VKEEILSSILEIRKQLGMSQRVPEITRVRGVNGNLLIECEDRADKSIIIGTGGWVVGKLSSQLDYKGIRVESRLDNIMKVRGLIGSLRELEHINNAHFKEFARAVLLEEESPKPINAYVIGEEMIWACGFLNGLGSSSTLLHTEFLHDNVKREYEKTDFVKIDCPTTPYDERIECLMDHIDEQEDGNIFFGFFDAPIVEKDNNIMVNPYFFFKISHWEAKMHAKKKYWPKVFKASDHNRKFYIRKILDMTYDGLIEPNDAASTIYHHWPTEESDLDLDRDCAGEFISEYRVANALKRAKKTSPQAYRALVGGSDGLEDIKAGIAWSGGIDSTACIRLSRKLGLDPDLITVCLPYLDMESMEAQAGVLGANLIKLDTPEDFEEVCQKVSEGNIHPCGQCSSLIEGAILEYANENMYDIIIFGDMLSTGSQSVVQEGELSILNLPAALSLPKRDLIESSGIMPTYEFGCPLLKEAHRMYKSAKRISIQRVLRELRAQMLDKRFAYGLIEDIME